MLPSSGAAVGSAPAWEEVVAAHPAGEGLLAPEHPRRAAAPGIAATIPEREDQLARRRARGSGRPYAFDAVTYKRRNVVERCFNRLKQWRGIATRYDKYALTYLGGLTLAAIVIHHRTHLADRS